jgi:E3 ubiquitin-protein ligase HUWE1
LQRINSLLATSDLDILILTLNLLLRPAQQYSAQQSVAQALNISTARLQSLAKRWPTSRDLDLSLVDLTSASNATTLDELPAESRDVVFSFYRKDDKPKADAPAPEPVDVFKTPKKSATAVPTLAAPSGGPVVVRIPASELEAKSVTDAFAGAVAAYSVPDSEQFELLCRVRASAALLPGQGAERVKLATARLLALAIFCHTHSEALAGSALFLYEPDLTTHVAELLQLDRGVPVAVQTAALAALDALARYRGRTSEVLGAVNAGVSHGILMALVRHTVADVAQPGSTLPHAFLDALLAFVTYLAQNAAGGSMIVSAGLVPLLIQLIENRLPSRLAVVSKTMQLIDIVLYGFVNAFQLFVAGRGVDALVNRIEVGALWLRCRPIGF